MLLLGVIQRIHKRVAIGDDCGRPQPAAQARRAGAHRACLGGSGSVQLVGRARILRHDAGTDRGRARFRAGPVGDRDQFCRRCSIFRILERSVRRSGAAISLSWARSLEIAGGSRVSVRLDQSGIGCLLSKDCAQACYGERDRDTGASPALSIQPGPGICRRCWPQEGGSAPRPA